MALQTLQSPWAPSWASGVIDDKPLPFEETSAETTRGYFKPPLWRRTYLGRWHVLASTEIRGGTFDLVGQWVRQAKASTELEDLGTLTARYSVNTAVVDLDLDRILSRSFGGFVLEMGDTAQHASFEAFANHMRSNRLTAEWDEGRRQLEVSYRSGADLMEAAFTTDFSQQTEVHFAVSPGVQERAIPYRRLNGQWPYLSAGLERDTTWAQQGTTGRLEKNGAVLTSESGRKAYLLADPVSGAVVGYNPLPDAQSWTLTTRDGAVVRPDGKVGLLRVEYRPWAGEYEIDYAPKPEQSGADMARNLIFTGLKQQPVVRLNGRPAEVAAAASGGFQIALI